MLYVVIQPCLTLGDPTDCSTPGLPFLHHLPELAHTHVYWVSDAIHPVLSSVASFSSCPQSFPVSGSFPMSWLFVSGGQNIGASASFLPMNIQDWFPFLFGDISVQNSCPFLNWIVCYLLGRLKSLFRFSHNILWKIWMNFLANPIIIEF